MAITLDKVIKSQVTENGTVQDIILTDATDKRICRVSDDPTTYSQVRRDELWELASPWGENDGTVSTPKTAALGKYATLSDLESAVDVTTWTTGEKDIVKKVGAMIFDILDAT